MRLFSSEQEAPNESEQRGRAVMLYTPTNTQSRQSLALMLEAALVKSGFVLTPMQGCHERVYTRTVRPAVQVLVYSSIVEGASGRPEVREVGADAIRAVALYTTKEGRVRPIAKAEKRVNRTGIIPEIVDRTLERARDVWRVAACTKSCCKQCGAPLFVSKKGNEVCGDLCFSK